MRLRAVVVKDWRKKNQLTTRFDPQRRTVTWTHFILPPHIGLACVVHPPSCFQTFHPFDTLILRFTFAEQSHVYQSNLRVQESVGREESFHPRTPPETSVKSELWERRLQQRILEGRVRCGMLLSSAVRKPG